MIYNLINYLAISVSSVDPLPLEETEDHTKLIVIIAVIAVVVIAAVFLWIKLGVNKKIRAARKKRAKKKADKKRDEELARLHRIKEKNKRK
jgi:Tfp pilus assembly protein PilO